MKITVRHGEFTGNIRTRDYESENLNYSIDANNNLIISSWYKKLDGSIVTGSDTYVNGTWFNVSKLIDSDVQLNYAKSLAIEAMQKQIQDLRKELDNKGQSINSVINEEIGQLNKAIELLTI